MNEGISEMSGRIGEMNERISEMNMMVHEIVYARTQVVVNIFGRHYFCFLDITRDRADLYVRK